MKIAKTAGDVLDDHVVFELECIDRVYLNLYRLFVLERGVTLS